jgi:hypothetical protein
MRRGHLLISDPWAPSEPPCLQREGPMKFPVAYAYVVFQQNSCNTCAVTGGPSKWSESTAEVDPTHTLSPCDAPINITTTCERKAYKNEDDICIRMSLDTNTGGADGPSLPVQPFRRCRPERNLVARAVHLPGLHRRKHIPIGRAVGQGLGRLNAHASHARL